MFIAGVLYLPQSASPSAYLPHSPLGQASLMWRVLFVLFWLLALFVVWKVLLKDGKLLVNRPALVRLT